MTKVTPKKAVRDKSHYAVLYLAWGRKCVAEAIASASSPFLENCDKFLITDQHIEDIHGLRIVRTQFQGTGLSRKAELWDYLPPGYRSYLFLDSDTEILAPIDLGFAMAEAYGLALAPASHYSLEYFMDFAKVMSLEKIVPRGQLQLNTGVIFFKRNNVNKRLFSTWRKLIDKHWRLVKCDQPYFSLALEIEKINPHVLSWCFNYRGFGDTISGAIRIWHSHGKRPDSLNSFSTPWPRYAYPGKVVLHLA